MNNDNKNKKNKKNKNNNIYLIIFNINFILI